MKNLYVLAGALLLSLAACSSQSGPTVHNYLLQPPGLSAVPTQVSKIIVVGNVDMSPFLAGSGVVQQREVNEVFEARYHRWAEPLSAQLQRQLRQALQQQLPDSTWLSLQGSAHLRSLDYRLDMQVDQFHLKLDGTAAVSGQWQLRDAAQGFVAAGDFSQSESLAADGYTALVEALQRAWHRALEDVASDLTRNLDSNARG